jgi:hypothetical protein
MKSEAVQAGLYSVERFDDKCVVETRVCNSYLLWSVVATVVFGMLAWGLVSIAWVLTKLPASAIPVVLIASVPAVVYWWRMPRNWAKRLALFGRRLELDRGAQQVRHTEIWVLGVRTCRCWRFDQIAEVVRPRNLDVSDGLAFRLEGGRSFVLDGENFDIPELLMLIEEYGPRLPSKRSQSAL